MLVKNRFFKARARDLRFVSKWIT